MSANTKTVFIISVLGNLYHCHPNAAAKAAGWKDAVITAKTAKAALKTYKRKGKQP